MEGEVGLHGHEPSVGISSFSAEFFREGCFDFHVVVFFIELRIYVDGGIGNQVVKSLGNWKVMEWQVLQADQSIASR